MNNASLISRDLYDKEVRYRGILDKDYDNVPILRIIDERIKFQLITTKELIRRMKFHLENWGLVGELGTKIILGWSLNCQGRVWCYLRETNASLLRLYELQNQKDVKEENV